MKRLQALLLGVLLTGCATDPFAQLETATPTLSPSQVADLRKRTVALRPDTVGEIRAPGTVTVPLVRVDTERPGEAGGRYRVPVVIGAVNGKAGVRLLLDSGSNNNLFGYGAARSLGVPLVEGLQPVISMGIGGAIDTYPALVPSVAIGSLEFRNLPALIGPDSLVLNFTRRFWGNTQVVLIGVNALRRLSYLTIDNLRGNVIIGANEAYLPDESRAFLTTAPLRWMGELPAVDISIDGRAPISCILDTGGDYGLLVPRSRASEWGYWKPGKGSLGTTRGVGGSSLTTTYEVRQAKVGGASFVGVPARSDLVGPEIAGGQAVFLGNVILRRYRVTFDFRHNVVWLER